MTREEAEAVLRAIGIRDVDIQQTFDLLPEIGPNTQRVGRLALGASTINAQQVNPAYDVDATRERLYAAMLEATEKAKSSHAGEDETSVQ
jgi:hypothetical protein